MLLATLTQNVGQPLTIFEGWRCCLRIVSMKPFLKVGRLSMANIRKFAAFATAALIAASVLSMPAAAHQGHADDMTAAEMALMDAQMAQMKAAHVGQPGPTSNDMATMMAETIERTPVDHTEKTPQPSGEQILAAKAAANRVTSLDEFLGRLHPVAAHFPIALLLVAALAELALMVRPAYGLQTTIKFLVAGGAIGAVLSAGLGWFAAGWRLSDRSQTLELHRWNGSAIAVVSLFAWGFAARSSGRIGLRAMLVILAAGLLTQGYLGGEMVFGPNHLGLQ